MALHTWIRTALDRIAGLDSEGRGDSPPGSHEHASQSGNIANGNAAKEATSDNVEQGTERGPGETRGFVERLKIDLRFRPSTYAKFNKDFPRIVPSLSDYPDGYTLLAAFQDVEPSFLMARRFKFLHNRTLLWYQDQLAELEDEYLQFEKLASQEKDTLRMKSRRHDEDEDDIRKDKLAEIEKMLQKYDDLLLRIKKLNSLPYPSARDMSSTFKFIKDTECQQMTERAWISHSEDLAALGPEYENDWFRDVIESFLKTISRRLTLKLFRTDTQRRQTGGHSNLHLVSKQRIDIVVYIVLSVLSTALLLIPVGILAWMQNGQANPSIIKQVLLIFGLTLAFTLLTAVLTRATRNQIFIASATYIAVLVVFLGSSLQNQGQARPP